MPCLPVRTCLFHEKHTFPPVWDQKRRFFGLSSLFLSDLGDRQGDKVACNLTQFNDIKTFIFLRPQISLVFLSELSGQTGGQNVQNFKAF